MADFSEWSPAGRRNGIMHRSLPAPDRTPHLMDILFPVLLTLCFFPSVTFGVIEAEIFPWAFLFALLFTTRRVVVGATSTALLLAFLGGSSIIVALGDHVDTDIARSLSAYLNFILAFLCFLSLPYSRIEQTVRIAKYILIGMVLLGIAQFMGLTAPLDGVFSALVPRASGELLLEMGGRGATLLSSEPSRAGVELAYLYFLYRLTQGYQSRLAFLDLALLAYLALVIRAAGPLAFGMLVVMMTTARSPRQMLLWAPALLLAPFIDLTQYGGRALDLISMVSSRDSLADTIFLLANESGHRLVAIYVFILHGFHDIFGAGVGLWRTSSVDALIASDVNYQSLRYFQIWGGGSAVAIRGPGVVSNMMLDIGIVGTLMFFYWVFSVTKPYRHRDAITRIVLIVLFVKIAFVGSVGEPLPWIVTAVLLRWNHHQWRMAAGPPQPASVAASEPAKPTVGAG